MEILRETSKLAQEAGKDVEPCLICTGLGEYVKVIFPHTNDWIHDKVFKENNGKKFKTSPDYRSDLLKFIVEFDGFPHYKNRDIIEKDKINQGIY